MPANFLQLYRLVICVAVIGLPVGAIAQSTAPQDVNAVLKTDLEITSENECVSLGGSWNVCPPNDCQKNPSYASGETVCPQVCGNPLCEGIIPATETDLSTVHNTDIDHQVQSGLPIKNLQNEPLSGPPKENKNPTTSNAALVQNPQESSSTFQKKLIVYTTLVALLLLVYLILKRKHKA